MKKMLQRGFTLIELLVVIAIIGILAAVVLASLNDARDSGSDASAKGSMTSVRNQAELWYNENSFTYTGACVSGTAVDDLVQAAGNASGGATQCNVITDGTAYAAEVLLSNGTSYFCVDSTGKATTSASSIGSGAVAANTQCP